VASTIERFERKDAPLSTLARGEQTASYAQSSHGVQDPRRDRESPRGDSVDGCDFALPLEIQDPGFDFLVELVTGAAITRQAGFFIVSDEGRVWDGPALAVHGAGEYRQGLVHLLRQDDEVVKVLLPEEAPDFPGWHPGDVDSPLEHHIHGKGVRLLIREAGGVDEETAPAELPQEPVGHEAAGPVALAQEQDAQAGRRAGRFSAGRGRRRESGRFIHDLHGRSLSNRRGARIEGARRLDRSRIVQRIAHARV
jgi:hypothetical protein